MKRLMILVLIGLFLVGCNQEAKIADEVNDHISQGDQYKESGKLGDAIALYNKALELKEDSAIRGKLNETELEKETVEGLQTSLEAFNEINTYYLQDSDYISPQKIEEAVKKLRMAIDEVYKLDDSQATEISTFIKDFKETSGISVIKVYVESDFTADGDTMGNLGFFNEDIQLINQLNASSFKAMGNYIENIANTEIPQKYQGN